MGEGVGVGIGAGAGASFLEYGKECNCVCTDLSKAKRRQRVQSTGKGSALRWEKAIYLFWNWVYKPILDAILATSSCTSSVAPTAMADDAAKMDSYYQFDEAKLEEVREKKEWMKE